MIANGFAFVVATLVSYLINTVWTFGEQVEHRTLVRFILVSIVGLMLSIVIAGACERVGLNNLKGVLMVVLMVPPLTFLLHSVVTYRLAALK